MGRLLLTVEETFFLRSRDILVLFPWLIDLTTFYPMKQRAEDLWPDFPRVPSPRPTQVELQLPDSTTRSVACQFADTHVNWTEPRSDTPPGFKPPWVVTCGLRSISKADVSSGTEVWYDTDS